MKSDLLKMLESGLLLLSRNSRIYGLDDPDEALFHEYLRYCEFESIEPIEDVLKALSISTKIQNEKLALKLYVEAIISINHSLMDNKEIDEIEKLIKIDDRWILTSINFKDESDKKTSFIDKLLNKDETTKIEITLETITEIDSNEDYVQYSINFIENNKPILIGDTQQTKLFIECNGDHIGPLIGIL